MTITGEVEVGGPDPSSPAGSSAPPVAGPDRRGGLPTHFPHMPALDGLRGVAVLLVLAYHFGADWLPGGFFGVDVFFVLSGYLITSLLLTEWGRHARIGLLAFWIRRARRLLPALFIVLVVVAVWAAIALPADQLDGVRSDSLWSLFYAANWHFIFSEQSYFTAVSMASPLRHMWSLAIEEQFYLLWPLLFVASLRLGRGRVRWLVGLCVVGAIASIVAMALLAGGGDLSRAYYGTGSRAHGLLLGALVAVGLARLADRPSLRLRRAQPLRAPGVLQIVGLGSLAALVAMAMFVTDRTAWLYPWGFLVVEVAVLGVILTLALTNRSVVSQLLSLRPLCYVGAISYGLYLWHWPVLVFIHEGNTELQGFALFAVRAGVTVGATLASYYLLEQPIRHGKWLHGWVGLATVPVAVVLVAGTILVSTRGAVPPPQYLVASPDAVLSIGDEVQDVPTTAEPPVTTVPDVPAPRDIGKVLLLGDSVAASLAPQLATAARDAGIPFAAEARPGCSLVGGLPVDDDGIPFSWSQPCEDGLPAAVDGVAARSGAGTVLWMSSWETADRLVDGSVYRFATPEADAMLMEQIDQTRAMVLRGTDSVLTFVLQAPNAERSDLGSGDADLARKAVHLNELLRRYAAEHPVDTRVLDLNPMMCPTGPPCPEVVDDIRPRPRDGAHYSDAGGAWLSPRLLELLAVAAG